MSVALLQIISLMRSSGMGFKSDGVEALPPPRAWLLEAAANSRHSESKLLSMLPNEVLARILELVAQDPGSLSSLARVNSDLRRFALGFRCHTLRLDYSPMARRLSVKLRQEALEGQLQAPLQDAINNYTQSWEILLGALTPSAMPNLEVFVAQGCMIWPESFFAHLSRSTVKHLYLREVMIRSMPVLAPPLMPPSWPLRSLRLGIALARPESPGQPTQQDVPSPGVHTNSPFFKSLLHLVGPTLEELQWRHPPMPPDQMTQEVSFGHEDLPVFPKLKLLRLESSGLDDTVTSTLFVPTLRHILTPSYHDVGLGPDAQYPDLESLVILVFPRHLEEARKLADFVARHPNLRKLTLGHPDYHREAPIDDHIVSVLASGSFRNLTCLSIDLRVRTGNEMEAIRVVGPLQLTALDAVGNITSLEKLELGGAVRLDAVRHHLRKLARLKILALDVVGVDPPYVGDDAPAEDHRAYRQDIFNRARHFLAMTAKEFPEASNDFNLPTNPSETDLEHANWFLIRFWATLWSMLGEVQKTAIVFPSLRLMLGRTGEHCLANAVYREASGPRVVPVRGEAWGEFAQVEFETWFGMFRVPAWNTEDLVQWEKRWNSWQNVSAR
ncbi:hypothetical protein B0I35DRAFT_266022 [Stachybotrys elegans]|uniref:F-box domain-containing protein n=1 Tax=Stachybotrys elegans TaxID=80388 RepID=A0A8K0SQH4_9HYPO|nr:hypothetical protein B0I35DRAFT_266022 [Stachybotrys elegans]